MKKQSLGQKEVWSRRRGFETLGCNERNKNYRGSVILACDATLFI